jgi:hypothetical protein
VVGPCWSSLPLPSVVTTRIEKKIVSNVM